MGWASHIIQELRNGKTVSFRPRGNSMQPRIESGQLCTVEPVPDAAVVGCGDVVLCTVGGRQYLHIVTAIQGSRFQIGNSRGGINGWTSARGIHGKLVSVAA